MKDGFGERWWTWIHRMLEGPYEGMNWEAKTLNKDRDKANPLLSVRCGIIIIENPFICGNQPTADQCEI